MSKSLTPQEQCVIDALMSNPKITRVELFKKLKIPFSFGNKMMNRQAVKDELAERRAQARYDSMISCKRIMEEEACIAFLDPNEILDKEGNLIEIKKLPERIRRALTIEVKQVRDNDGKIKGVEYKYVMLSKEKALERIGRHLGIYEKDNLQKAISVYFMSNGELGAPEAEIVPEIDRNKTKPTIIPNKAVALLE